jgi:hypothetical protein
LRDAIRFSGPAHPFVDVPGSSAVFIVPEAPQLLFEHVGAEVRAIEPSEPPEDHPAASLSDFQGC